MPIPKTTAINESNTEARDIIQDGVSYDIEHPQIPWYMGTFFMNFVAGGISSSIAESAMAPFERVKLLLQLQKSSKHFNEHPEYKGVIATFKRIHVEQGFLSFWRGNSANVIRCFPYQALNFSLKDGFRNFFNSSFDVSTFSRRVLANLTAGGLAGSCALAVIYPLDYARTRLAVENGKGKNREFSTIRQTLVDAYKHDGRVGLYRGFVCSIFGIFVYRAVYFGMFDSGVEVLPAEYRHNFWVEFCLADFAGICGSLVSYPFDTVRRSMMMQSGSGHMPKKYMNYADCFRKIYRNYGFRGFYHGGFINGMRGIGGALMLILYERVQAGFISLNPNSSKISYKKCTHIPPFICPT